jgi:hypothetical protein
MMRGPDYSVECSVGQRKPIVRIRSQTCLSACRAQQRRCYRGHTQQHSTTHMRTQAQTSDRPPSRTRAIDIAMTIFSPAASV